MNKRLVAREWVYFIGGLVVGLLWPAVVEFAIGDPPASEIPRASYAEVLFIEPEPLMWLLVLAPYLLFQLVRSVIWAARTLRDKP